MGHPAPLLWIDGLRVAAALSVVWLHVSAQVVRGAPVLDSTTWWIGNVFDAAVRWAVPVFVMVSGALLLERDPPVPASRFLARRAGRILPVIAFWSVLYLLARAAFGWKLTLGTASWALYHGRPEHHLWYLYMVLGLYLATPALRALLARTSERQHWALVAVCFAAAAFYHWAAAFAGAPPADTVFTMWLLYVGYYLCGHQLRRQRLDAVPLAIAVGSWIASVAVIALGTGALVADHGFDGRGLYWYAYVSPAVIASSLAAFLIGRRVFAAIAPDGALARIVRRLAPLSLGLYVVHVLVLTLLQRTAGIDALRAGAAWLGIPLVTALACALSLALARLLLAVPVLRRTVA